MNLMVELTGAVRVPLPPAEAVELFTPEGEREWVPGWDPRYPGGTAVDCRPGTVFVTSAAGRDTTWVVAEHGALVRGYARVVPGVQAGTVTVRCRPEAPGTRAEVTYRTTALTDAGRDDLARFAEAYPAYLGEWERRIAEAVAARG